MLQGRVVSEDEAVSTKSVGPSTVIRSKLSPEERIEALRPLNERFRKTQRLEAGADEEEAAVNAALRSTRPNYRAIV
jgi:hypothetical protein